VWLATVFLWFRRSNVVLISGLAAIGVCTLIAVATHKVAPAELGLALRWPWLPTLGLTLAWLGLMVAWSPVADRLATRWFRDQPNLRSFRVIRESRLKLVAGIVVAWILGAVLEELVFRGIVLSAVQALLLPLLGSAAAAAIGVAAAALGAGIIHLYQGPRAALVIIQLSVLFGLLFVVSRHNLYTVMVCHGAYDTIAFVRFANRKSRYSLSETPATR